MVVRMVTRRRLRSVLTTLGLYLGAALLIGYFYVNAYTGNHGITARQGLDVQMARLATERDTLRAERQQWERRVALLKSQSLDPDMLDERARALLDYVDARDLTLMVQRRSSGGAVRRSLSSKSNSLGRHAVLSPRRDFG